MYSRKVKGIHGVIDRLKDVENIKIEDDSIEYKLNTMITLKNTYRSAFKKPLSVTRLLDSLSDEKVKLTKVELVVINRLLSILNGVDIGLYGKLENLIVLKNTLVNNNSETYVLLDKSLLKNKVHGPNFEESTLLSMQTSDTMLIILQLVYTLFNRIVKRN